MLVNKQLIDDCSRLLLKIKVIGYASQGESIIFELVDDSKKDIIYIGLIDSYVVGKNRIAFDYLAALNPCSLNCLCWSHPDTDHSVGLKDIIDKYCNETTKFCIPATLDEKLNNALDLSEKHKEIFDSMKKHWITHPNNLMMITGGYGNKIDEIFFKDRLGQEVDFRIWGIAPHGGDIRLWRETKVERVKNILSVGLEIELGCYRFIFSGDMPDESILEAYDLFFQDPVWLKIPHHGSTSSRSMINKITYDSNNLYACTTVYTGQGLPKEEVLNSYLSNVGVRIDSTDTGVHSYGIVDYTFDLFGHQRVKITHQGNARQYLPEE